ncbi:MAG: hypothetical protein M1836_007561 [Candelina mexicana]|nr:MAG: hypothetical protein M1836_007561 [Candelina mexicana]
MPKADQVPQPGPARISKGGGPDEWLEAAKQCKYLPEADMKRLCEIVKECLMEESNIQPVRTPVTICGDIHGQFYDLLELFRVAGGMPNETHVEAPTVPTKVITSDDIEPPSEITDPKLKRKVRSPSGVGGGGSAENSDGEEEVERGRRRQPGPTRGQSKSKTASNGQDNSADVGPRNYIFLGDFVDRGYFSLETFTLLMCLKAKQLTIRLGFLIESRSSEVTTNRGKSLKFTVSTKNAKRNTVFDFLALAAIVDGKVLCVHGGLSPEIRTLDQIRVVARAQEIPHEGAFCDLVWSDPEEVDTWAVSPRGAGWLFGDKVSSEFNHVNGLQLIARAHQLVNEGYKYHFKNRDVVTVWSAPNYCYRCGNVASIMNMKEDLNPKFSIFSAVPDDQRAVPAGRGGRGEYFL